MLTSSLLTSSVCVLTLTVVLILYVGIMVVIEHYYPKRIKVLNWLSGILCVLILLYIYLHYTGRLYHYLLKCSQIPF
jgi:uncharacterized membrane protein